MRHGWVIWLIAGANHLRACFNNSYPPLHNSSLWQPSVESELSVTHGRVSWVLIDAHQLRISGWTVLQTVVGWGETGSGLDLDCCCCSWWREYGRGPRVMKAPSIPGVRGISNFEQVPDHVTYNDSRWMSSPGCGRSSVCGLLWAIIEWQRHRKITGGKVGRNVIRDLSNASLMMASCD